MNTYEEKTDARRTRYEARAERCDALARAAYRCAKGMADMIPFGQPILVGHHSEKRDRAYRARMNRKFDQSVEFGAKARYWRDRAESVGNDGISSDDPKAVEKLRHKITRAEAFQSQMLMVNGAWRTHGKPKANNAEAWLAIIKELAGKVTQKAIDAGRLNMAQDFIERGPFPFYSLQNNGANIRRMRKRIASLERQAAQEMKTTERLDGVRVVENVETNRLQILFPAKPSPEIRRLLKQVGFRWSPSEGAWQRHLNGGARAAAEYVLGKA